MSRSEDVAQDLLSHIYDDLNEASNKFVEWTIQRDDKGNVVRGPDGQPLAQVGPEQTVSKKLGRGLRELTDWACRERCKLHEGVRCSNAPRRASKDT